jgi:hypothetical protein
MTMSNKLISISGLVLALTAVPARADDPAPPSPAQPPAQSPAEPSKEDAKGAKNRFGLWVGVAGGQASAKDLNMSIRTTDIDTSVASLSLEDQLHVRAGIGWRLPEGKGDFRVAFQGFKDDDYLYSATGRQLFAILLDASGQPSGSTPGNANCVEGEDLQACLMRWWTVQISNGQMVARRDIPLFAPTTYLKDANNNLVLDSNGNCIVVTQGDDLNCNNTPEPNEVHYALVPDLIVQSPAPRTLENQAQTVDLLYGREFGGRRFSSRWWAGLRYFKYTGNLMSTAWLNLTIPGEGFTDGGFLNPLILAEKTTGLGPTASWEVDFNFFNKGLALFVRGQAAFTLNSMEIDSGSFPVPADSLSPTLLTGRINETRDKSTWQDQGEVGVRVNLHSGLQFELGYARTGFLDVLLIPSEITGVKTGTVTNVPPSTLYTTQDYILDGWHAGVSFQF